MGTLATLTNTHTHTETPLLKFNFCWKYWQYADLVTQNPNKLGIDIVSLVYFCFCGLCFWYYIQGIIAKSSKILFSLRRKSAICDNSDEPGGLCTKQSKSVFGRTNTACIHLNEVFKIVKCIETESKMPVARGWVGAKIGGGRSIGKVSVTQDE